MSEQTTTITPQYNGMPEEWLVEGSGHSAGVHLIADGNLHCFECWSRTCYHVRAVREYLREEGEND